MPTPSSFSRRNLIAGAAASLGSGLAAARDPLGEIERKVGGRLGVFALDVLSGRALTRRASERFPMCSTFKAMAVAALLKRVDSGQERLDRFIRYGEADLLSYAPVSKAHLAQGGMTLADICAAAIEYSDNTAANAILAAIGGPAGWTRFVRSLGDARSRLDRNEPTLNTAIPGDPRDTAVPVAMAGDLRRVLIGDALSPASRERLTGWMVDCKTGMARLRAGLPRGWRIADKTGSGENATSNDIAVAWSPRGPIVIICYLTGATAATGDARDAAIADVGRMVAEAFGHG